MRANLLAFTLRTDQVSITPVLDHDHHLSRQINKFVIASDHFTIFPPKGQRAQFAAGVASSLRSLTTSQESAG